MSFNLSHCHLDDKFVPLKEEGNNKRYAGKKFGLIMTLKETDYKNGTKIDRLSLEMMFILLLR